MEGFILAAGLGTRLLPLTAARPKALMEVQDHTLLELCLMRLTAAGVHHVVVNVHHLADTIVEYLTSRQWPCTVTVSDERGMLLDTGGALRKAAPLFSGEEPVVVHNVDVLSRINLRQLEAAHRSDGNLATLCVSQRATQRQLAFSPDGRLIGREGATADIAHATYAFSGIAMVSPELFAMLPEADHPYPIIEEYIRLSAAGNRIGMFRHAADDWLDVGKPETLKQAQSWKLSFSK